MGIVNAVILILINTAIIFNIVVDRYITAGFLVLMLYVYHIDVNSPSIKREDKVIIILALALFITGLDL